MRRTLATALGALAATLLWGCGDGRPPAPAATTTVTYRVSGMHCDGCAEAIVAEVSEVKGVQRVECAFATRKAVVTLDGDAARPEVERAITKLGYQVAPADAPAQPPASR
jgi:copper chaperone CopZ